MTDPANIDHSKSAAPALPSIIRSAALMSLATLLSRILGMVRDVLMAAFFPRMVTDAYVVAFRLPNLFRRILGEGSMAASFVPLYVEALGRNDEEARSLANAVFSMLMTLTASISVAGVIFMSPFMGWWVGGEGYMQVAGKFELTVFMAQIMFCYLFLVTTYAFLMSVANAHKSFFLPALAPAAFNVLLIVSALMPSLHVQGDQLAWGVVAGGIAQLLLTAQPLIRLKHMPRFSWLWNVQGTARFFRNVLPGIVGMSLAQLLGIMNVNFASQLGQGTHSYIYLADRLLEFPQSLVSVSLGVALLPTLSGLWWRGERVKFLETVARHIRLLMVLSLPAAVGLYVLAEPITRVIYGRGEFGEADILVTSQVVAIYATILVTSGLHRVTVPAFYAVKNTWLPAVNSVLCLLVHYFVARYATEHYGLQGLVGATAFTGALNLGVLLMSYKILFGELGAVPFVRSVLWMTPALLAMGLSAPLVYAVLLAPLGALASLLMTLVVAAVLFFAVNRLLRHPDSNEVLGLVIGRLRR